MSNFLKSILLSGGGGMPYPNKVLDVGGMLNRVCGFFWRRDADRIKTARAKRQMEQRLINDGMSRRLAKIIVAENFLAAKTE